MCETNTPLFLYAFFSPFRRNSLPLSADCRRHRRPFSRRCTSAGGLLRRRCRRLFLSIFHSAEKGSPNSKIRGNWETRRIPVPASPPSTRCPDPISLSGFTPVAPLVSANCDATVRCYSILPPSRQLPSVASMPSVAGSVPPLGRGLASSVVALAFVARAVAASPPSSFSLSSLSLTSFGAGGDAAAGVSFFSFFLTLLPVLAFFTIPRSAGPLPANFDAEQLHRNCHNSIVRSGRGLCCRGMAVLHRRFFTPSFQLRQVMEAIVRIGAALSVVQGRREW